MTTRKLDTLDPRDSVVDYRDKADDDERLLIRVGD
jgi:hypothetical protein